MNLTIDYRQQISAFHNMIKIIIGNDVYFYCDRIEIQQIGSYITLYLFSFDEVTGIIPIEEFNDIYFCWKC